MQSMQVGTPFQECKFEITPYPAAITGEMKTSVYETGGVEPTAIIRTDQDWYVLVEFILRGPLAHHLCGEFCVCLHIECFGAGLETSFCEYIEMDPCKPDDEWYKVKINVPAGTVPGTAPGAECGVVCCLAVTLTSILPCEPRRPGHIAAYCQGPCVMFALPPAPH